MAGAVLAGAAFDLWPDWRAIVQVAGRGRTERRILQTFVRYGVTGHNICPRVIKKRPSLDFQILLV